MALLFPCTWKLFEPAKYSPTVVIGLCMLQSQKQPSIMQGMSVEQWWEELLSQSLD